MERYLSEWAEFIQRRLHRPADDARFHQLHQDGAAEVALCPTPSASGGVLKQPIPS